VLLEGQEVARLPLRQLAQKVAVVTQDNLFEFDFTTREIILMGRAPHLSRFGFEGPQDQAIVEEAMRLTQTSAFERKPVTTLSGGERQRCLLARALAQQPEILLLDEPTAHLDINYQLEILELARTLTSQKNFATLVVLHDLNLASQYCDRLVLLAAGRVVAAGTPAEVITEDHIRQAYHTETQVRTHPETGRPYVSLISKRGGWKERGIRTTRVHVICGAGTGAALMRRLHEQGFQVSIGVVNVADTDQAEAELLDLPRAEEAPFSPISEEAHAANLELIRQAEVVVMTAAPYGKGNLLNLAAAQEGLTLGRRVLILDQPAISERDFSGGEASQRQRELEGAGAELIGEEAKLFSCLEALL
jgi:iron complex transport system ATP-binding protein